MSAVFEVSIEAIEVDGARRFVVAADVSPRADR